MPENEHITGFVRVIEPRYKQGAQVRALHQAGIGDLRIYVEGSKRGHTLNDVIRNLRDGDVVAVLHAFLLSDPRMKRKRGGYRADLWSKVDAIEDRGASIWELSTDLQSSDRKQRETMLREAVEALARGRHKTVASDKRGRPGWKPDETELLRAKVVWMNPRHKRWPDAVAALKKLDKRWSQARAYRELGKRSFDEEA